MRDAIRKPRTAPALEFINNSTGLIKHDSYWAVVTPHRKAGTSELTMGTYQNYTHTEYTFQIFGEQIRMIMYTVHNDHAKTGGTSMIYRPEYHNPEEVKLFEELIQLTREEKHRIKY
jgi:malate synthase